MPMVDHQFNGGVPMSPPPKSLPVSRYYASAPTTPIHTGASCGVVPFDWELTPGTPKHSIGQGRFEGEDEEKEEEDPSMEFAFQFSGHKEEGYISVTADELFEKGKIIPLKPPPSLQKASPSLTPPKSPLSRFFRRDVKAEEELDDPFEKAIEETTRGRDRDRWLKGGSIRGSGRALTTRSLSPLRKNPTASTNITTPRSNGSGKKWSLIKDLLLFRSSSQGRMAQNGNNRNRDRDKGLMNNKYKGMSFPVVKNSPVIFGKYSFQDGWLATTTSSERMKREMPFPHRRGFLGFLGLKR